MKPTYDYFKTFRAISSVEKKNKMTSKVALASAVNIYAAFFSVYKRLQKFFKKLYSGIDVVIWVFFTLLFLVVLKLLLDIFCDFYKNFLIVDLFGFDFKLLHLSVQLQCGCINLY